MSKAALEAMNGADLYGLSGAHRSVIFIDIDAHYRNRTNFDSLLPRESASNNTDVSLIPTVSWPAFAIHDENLVGRTMDKITRKLQGRYGLKRFLRDGYGTVLEDQNRKHYRPAEIKNFDSVESEWPMFFCYLLIDSVYRGDLEKVEYYQKKIQSLVKESEMGPIVPKYYFVPAEYIEAERANPGSQPRDSSSEGENGNLFLWGQSVYIISQLLVEGLLNIHELDPIRRYLPAAERPKPSSRYSSFQSSPSDLVIQVVLISESVRLQQMLGTYGIQTQTPHQIEPMQIWPPSELVRAYEQLGINSKLGLSGRPSRPIGGLGTAKIYRACGHTFLCYPLLFEVSDFYLSHDMQLLIEDIKSDLMFLGKCWKLAGRPTFCMVIREENIRGPNAQYLMNLLAQFKRGDCDGIKVRLGRLQEFIQTACIEHLDFLKLDNMSDLSEEFNPVQEQDHGKTFKSLSNIASVVSTEREHEKWLDASQINNKSNSELAEIATSSDNFHAQAQALQLLLNREGLHHRVCDITVEERLEALNRTAGQHQQWAVVRWCSSLLGKVVDSLAPSITAILVRGKQVAIGVFGHEEEIIDKPATPTDIHKILYSRCFPHDVTQAVLQQEIIINIGKFISTSPELFSGILTIRIGWMIQAMKLELEFSESAASRPSLDSLSPSTIKKLMIRILRKSDPHPGVKIGTQKRSVIWNRQLDGALNRTPRGIYDRVWQILERTPGGLKVAGHILAQQPTLSDMTRYELNFSLLVEKMLGAIPDPAYRQMMVETFMVVSTILERNRELSFQNLVDMDKLLLDGFNLWQVDRARLAGEEKSDSMDGFYNTPPNIRHGTTSYLAKAVINALLDGDMTHAPDHCTLQ